MTKEFESLMVLQNESFGPQRFYDSYVMDAWKSYGDGSMVDPDRTKTRLNTEDDITTISLLCDPFKTQKEQKLVACSRSSSIYKPLERNLSATLPDLAALESPTHIMKLLSDSISASQPQEALDLNKKLAPLCTAKPGGQPDEFIVPGGETYDRHAINHFFDTILSPPAQQKWGVEAGYMDAASESLSYTEPLLGDQASPVYSDSYTNSPPDRYRNDFQFILGSPRASQHKTTDMPMVYLNKGQFYPITLQGMGADSAAGLSSSKVKTVIMAVFENDKNAEVQLKCWNHWHARQPTIKQRVIDIADYKEVLSGISNVEEVAFNALSFIWNTNEEAKVYIGINSLSTDFSSQKGVKGLPLNLQIDTYDFSTGSNRLIHRAACQVKVFCDKGAERKMRDEERKRVKRRGKTSDSSNNNNSSSKQSAVSSSIGGDCTYFKTMDDLVTQPVLFIPEVHFSSMQRIGLAPPTTLEEAERTSLKRRACPPYPENGEHCSPPAAKQPRHEEQQRVLLYVRTESEEVFDALMLGSPTLRGLKMAISEKYNLQEDTIGKIYKKCKRGIFVNMDDNIIEHYSNHSAFLMEISEAMGQFQVTLTEL
ncbi:grainyhead-like protein 3 homolog isoform X2 [Conger conger]|uniref:grainyhead-like protein 3 homolog isoform X2 n=1 Tax=Conger conger TaxID=82655 RepID=UPI002A59B99B|nr:grainyhead-like protein 3 homolog isoform X2 [Conger conger]